MQTLHMLRIRTKIVNVDSTLKLVPQFLVDKFDLLVEISSALVQELVVKMAVVSEGLQVIKVFFTTH